jgi:hypothetical protein
MENDIELTLSSKLESFLKFNPTACLETDDKGMVVRTPWNDHSLEIRIKEDDDLLVDTLNHVLLPFQLTAIYHFDKCCLEFIFSVRAKDGRYWDRDFQLTLNGETYHCYYGSSTDRLLHIAKAFTESELQSSTNYRNLKIFRDFCKKDEFPEPIREFFEDKAPLSFFVEPIKDKSIDSIIEIARNLNFYMHYFDRHTPLIIIHNPEESDFALYEKEDSKFEFPKEIIGSNIDTYLLDLWNSTKGADGRLAFIYFYQIIEYAAFYYLDEQVKLNLVRALKRPDVLSSLDDSLSLIIDKMVDYRMTDEQKLVAVIQRCVDPRRLWKFIECDKEYYSAKFEFDGGFSLDPLIRKEWTVDDFVSAWTPKLPDSLRKIRNALVHSRENRMGQVISPTTKNSHRLRHWVNLIEEVALQVAVFENI